MESDGLPMQELDTVLSQLIEAKMTIAQLHATLDTANQEHKQEIFRLRNEVNPAQYRVEIPMLSHKYNTPDHTRSLVSSIKTDSHRARLTTGRTADGTEVLPSEIGTTTLCQNCCK